jgi:hypothetical protein
VENVSNLKNALNMSKNLFLLRKFSIKFLNFSSIKIRFFEELLCDGEHEHLSHVTPVCPMSCQSLGRAHCMSLIMKDSCQCSEGTIRDTVSGKCVKHEECPNHE